MGLPTDDVRKGGSFSRFVAALADAMLLMLVVLLFPLIILLIGAPIAFVVRVLIEMARRL